MKDESRRRGRKKKNLKGGKGKAHRLESLTSLVGINFAIFCLLDATQRIFPVTEFSGEPLG